MLTSGARRAERAESEAEGRCVLKAREAGVLTSFSGDRLRLNPVAAEEHKESGEHDGAAEDGRETGSLGEDQPGEERGDDGFGEDGAGDDRGLYVAERPVKDRVAHDLGPERYRREPEPGLPGIAPEPNVEDERGAKKRERGGGVHHDRVRQDPDAPRPGGAPDQDVDRDRDRPDEGEHVTEDSRRPDRAVA